MPSIEELQSRKESLEALVADLTSKLERAECKAHCLTERANRLPVHQRAEMLERAQAALDEHEALLVAKQEANIDLITVGHEIRTEERCNDLDEFIRRYDAAQRQRRRNCGGW